MGRLIAAVIVLLVTLLGLRVISSPLFQQGQKNNSDSVGQGDTVTQTEAAVPQPRSTGVSSEIPPTEPSLPPTGTGDYTPPPPVISPSPEPDKGQMW